MQNSNIQFIHFAKDNIVNIVLGQDQFMVCIYNFEGMLRHCVIKVLFILVILSMFFEVVVFAS